MTENTYERWLCTDNDLCLPVVDQQRLNAILGETAVRVFQGLGEGPEPKVFLDLEHLQVADYGTFEGVTDEQQQFISELHAAEPIRPEEMMFLALRSLFQFTWPEPQSESDIRFAAAYDFVLNQVLVDTALNLAGSSASQMLCFRIGAGLVSCASWSNCPQTTSRATGSIE